MDSARQRSPNYPGHGLEEALRFVKSVYIAEKRSPVPAVVIAQALSTSSNEPKGISGPARTKIAAMRQFGLLETVSDGRARVSELALAIIHKPSPEEYVAALQEAAFLPPLFAEIRAEHADASDAALRFHLLKKAFTEDGANRVIKAYRETADFVEREAQSNSVSVVPKGPMAEAFQDTSNFGDLQPGTGFGGSVSQDNFSGKRFAMAYTWPLPDGVDAHVAFNKRPTVRGIDRLITLLQFMRDDLNVVAPPETASKAAAPATEADGSAADS